MLGFSMMVLDVEGVESLGFRVPGLKFLRMRDGGGRGWVKFNSIA